MILNLGKVRPGSTLYFPFDTFAAATGAPITASAFAVGDILVYKDGGTTQRASTNGYTLLDTDGIDFDGVTGLHGYSIDLADNSTAGFWAAGSRYQVAVSPITVDSLTMAFWHAVFTIGYDGSLFDTTIATLATQTSFTLTAGPAEDDALNGCLVAIHDVASAVQMGYAVVQDYTGSTKTVTLVAGTTFTAAATDNISILPPTIMPTVAGRTLDVSATGEAGVDWANVGSPTTTVALTNTTINSTQKVDVETIKTNSVVNAGTVTFPTNATLASTTNITAGTMTTATNVTTVNGLAANVITAASMAADASAEIADQVWDEAIAGHLGAGTTGLALNSAGSAGDPWNTAVPGAYAAGTAGSKLGRIPDVAAGAAGGLFIAGSNAATTVNITGTMTTVTNVTTVNGLANNVLTAASTAADFVSEIGGGGGGLDAAGVRAAIGLASANLDTQLADVPTNAELASAVASVTVTTNNDKTGYALTAGERNSVADALLDRNMATGTDSGSPTVRTVRQALRFLRNKWSIAGTTLTVTKEDDSTASWTATVTTDAGSAPVVGNDPAGP